MSTSVLVQAAAKSARRRTSPLLGALAHALAFGQPGELLFGALLTYYFRILERQMGTAKYGAYTLLVAAAGFAVQAALAAAQRPAAPGPYPLLFANMVAFFLEVPALQRFSVAGVTLSDKIFCYLAAGQLLLSGGQRSLAAGLSGLLAGLAYHSGALGLQRVRLPRALQDFVSATVGRALGGAPQQQIFVTPAARQRPAGVAGPGRGGAAARGPAVPPAEPSPEAVQQLVEMGFDAEAARQALRAASNNVELALQALL